MWLTKKWYCNGELNTDSTCTDVIVPLNQQTYNKKQLYLTSDKWGDGHPNATCWGKSDRYVANINTRKCEKKSQVKRFGPHSNHPDGFNRTHPNDLYHERNSYYYVENCMLNDNGKGQILKDNKYNSEGIYHCNKNTNAKPYCGAQHSHTVCLNIQRLIRSHKL